MAQFLRPDGNITQTSVTGGFANIDESTASDADFVYGDNNTSAVLEVSLSNPAGTPGSTTPTIRYRIAKTNNGVLDNGGSTSIVICNVYEGATRVAFDIGRTATGTWTTYSFSPDLSAVTNWNDLRLRFELNGGGGSPANRRGAAVSWAEMEVADALAGITGTLVVQESGSDDFTASGLVLPNRTGTLTATESGSDDFSASGTVTDPSLTGTLVVQEAGSDDFSATGTVVWPTATGDLVAVETGSDDLSASGTVEWPEITGTLSTQETNNDDFSATGTVTEPGLIGTLAVAESGSDDFSSVGNVLISGTLAANDNGSDTFSGTGSVVSDDPSGSLSAVESGKDQSSITGLVLISGALDSREPLFDDFSASGITISRALGRRQRRFAKGLVFRGFN